METTNVRDVLVIDMTSLRFSWSADRTAVALLTQRGEMVAVIDTQPDSDQREQAYRAMDAALDKGKVLRTGPTGDRVRYQVAFYNPYTAQVSVGAVGQAPHCIVLGDTELLELPSDGAPGVLERGADVALHVAGRTLTEIPSTFAALTRTLAAHLPD